MIDEFTEYQNLCEQIWEHNRLYYSGEPIISDEEFDALYRQLLAIERKHPAWVDSTSPTQRVGEALTSGFKTIAHTNPMLSLENCYSQDEIMSFLKRVEKLSEQSNPLFTCELKMDGIAVTVRYEKGRFVRALTRGNGRLGDDVTNNVKVIEALPLRLSSKGSLPDILEVRGEIFMLNKVFEQLNQKRQAQQEDLWANPRNAAAGALKLLDPKEVASRKLSIVFYGLAEESSVRLERQYDCHPFLKSFGLPTLTHVTQCQGLDGIWQFAEEVRKLRPHLPFNIDGIVIKLDHLRLREKLGYTAKHPRWAIAYKFAAEQAETRIREILVSVGRSGVLTPIAMLEPVFLAGSTISKATLHNAEEVQRKDIRAGDYVVIEKGGDVIPKVVKALVEKRLSDSKPWCMPSFCPICSSPVVQVAGEVAVRCPNRDDCGHQILGRLEHFAGKSGLDIENMGEKVIHKLVEKGFVSRASDIFKLSKDELAQLEGFKEKSINNLLNSIKSSKDVSLGRFIMALGIPHVGIGTAELLAEHAKSIENLATFTQERLMMIEGIGEKVASSVVTYLAKKENAQEIERLLAAGVQPRPPAEKKVVEGHPWSGKTFVLTGTLAHFTRAEATVLIAERRGKITNSVSKKTDFLVAGDEAGSKLDKAKELGVAILDEQAFKVNL